LDSNVTNWGVFAVNLDPEVWANSSQHPSLAFAYKNHAAGVLGTPIPGTQQVVNNPSVSIVEYTQTAVGPETFIQVPNGGAPASPWSAVGEVINAYQNADSGLHPLFECQNSGGGVAVWDFYTSMDGGCEGAGKQYFSAAIGYVADAPSATNPRAIYRCHWSLGGSSHMIQNDLTVSQLCTGSNGWVSDGVLGYAPN
jgi:hypothetical protein